MSYLRLAAAYALWVATLALSVGAIWVWRSALLALFVRLRLDKYAYAAYNDAIVIALAVAWLILAIVSEAWFRESADRRALRRMALRMDGIVLGLVVIGYVAFRALG